MTKNKMADVRDYLVQALEDLSDPNADADKMARTIERAKTISTVAGTYVQTVKVEIDARRLADEIGVMPVAFDTPPALPRHDEPSGNVSTLPNRGGRR
ncbi:hypothetical protein LQ772_06590 [Frateuria edaphi]|uniref:hypothetical protein n=1 Tax=Frateuria edaphi TaxID=2898793 RepID=UPI001E5CF14F|nr:hypothetical protein [Frateuria edaphi]UGB46953.1 hypothetical protein LQ772_06590 [Frateuria edaphi]